MQNIGAIIDELSLICVRGYFQYTSSCPGKSLRVMVNYCKLHQENLQDKSKGWKSKTGL